MSNRYFSKASRPGPQQLHAPDSNRSPSKRSFHTGSSDSASQFADTSTISNRPEKRKISPVFQDLATAHSLITSGKAKNLTSPERDHYRKRSSSSSDADHQLGLMNKRSNKLASDLQAPQRAPLGRNWGEEKHGVLKFDDDEDDDKIEISQTRMAPSNSLQDDGAYIKRPQTPLIPKLWDMAQTNSANRPPMAGGRLNDVQWPSTNPYNKHSPYQRLSRKHSGIFSPQADGLASTYSASAYGKSKGLFHPSPHGLPSPIVSKSGSGSSAEPRSSYPAEGMRLDEYDAGIRNKDNHCEGNYVFDAPTRHTENQESQYSRSVPQHSEGSTVNHILDHYTHASDGSYYAVASRGAMSQNHQTPSAARRLNHAVRGPGAATPSTEEDEGSHLSLRRFPGVPSPAYHRAESSGNVGYSSYGDSHALLGTYHQSGRLRDSIIPPPPVRKNSQVAKGRRVPPLDIGRQVSIALRDFDQDDSYVEVSSPVIKKPAAAKLLLRPRKPIEGSFQNVNNSNSGHISNGGTIRYEESNDDKENIPPRSVDEGFIGSDFQVGDIRIETTRGEHGEIVRKISKRRAPAANSDDQEEWESVLDADVYGSPALYLPFTKGMMANYGNFRQTGSSIADVSDFVTSSSGAIRGPYLTNQRVLVHPARDRDVFEKQTRPLPDGSGRTYLPVPEIRRGGFGSNSFRGTPAARLLRTFSQHLSSPRGSSSPRHQYYELDEIKKGASSPYSPPRRPKTPNPQQSMSRIGKEPEFGGIRLSTVPWGTDGAHSRHESAEFEGFEFDQNQRPERPDSYMEMVKAANKGKLPWFLQASSLSGSSGKTKGTKRIKKAPEPYREHYHEHYHEQYHEHYHEQYCEYCHEPYQQTPIIRYPPRIFSTTNSIADYSDDEASYIDPLDGPEYDNPPVSSNSRSHGRSPRVHHNHGRFESSEYSPQTESPYVNRFEGFQKPLAPGGFYNNLRSTIGSRRRARGADLESGRGPNVARGPPQDNRNLRPLLMKPSKKPSVTNPRAPHEFQYRSPRAPIQSPTWERLYRASHLGRINNALAIDPNLQIRRPSPAYVTPNGTRMARADSWMVSPGSPHLLSHSHDRSSVGAFAARKEKISWWALVGCVCIFFPLLLLYSTGLLDSVMERYTKGDIRSFGSRQKKWAAWILMTLCLLAMMITIVVLVALNKMGTESA